MAAKTSVQRWLQMQAQASQAEHDLLMALASSLNGGSPAPSSKSISRVQRLHTRARTAMNEALGPLANVLQGAQADQARGWPTCSTWQYVLGAEHTYQHVVLALIETHTDKDALHAALGRHFARPDSDAPLPAAGSFEQGQTDAQNLIRVASVVEPDTN